MTHSTKALTVEQKQERIEAKRNAAQGDFKDIPLENKPQIRKAPERTQRTSRGIFNGSRGKLKISEQDVKNFAEAGWHLHIFNDDAGRIESALSLGYEFVERNEIGGVVANVVDGNTDLGNRVRFRVGRTEAGDGLFAYLMKIPTSTYLAEQQDLQKRNDIVDAAIRAGKNVKAGSSTEGFYGQDGIKISN